jgi:hypothetical protein
MSHFVTLVNFYMPKLEENCEENMRYAEQIAEVKEKLAQDPESFALRFLLKRLQSKASTLERSAECEIDELMAPFCEGTDDPAYLEFEDRTDDLRQDYETDKINCIRFPDGTVVPEYSRLVCEKYLIRDDKVFQKKAGHLGHEKRTKKAKKMRAFMGYPVKKLYPSLRTTAVIPLTARTMRMGITAIRMPSGIGIPLAAAGRSNSLSVTQRNELTVSAHGATKMLYVKRPKAIYGSAAQEKGILHGNS